MRISVVGRGNVDGGLADLWEQAGHKVTRIVTPVHFATPLLRRV